MYQVGSDGGLWASGGASAWRVFFALFLGGIATPECNSANKTVGGMCDIRFVTKGHALY